jgi:hypothetical protein
MNLTQSWLGAVALGAWAKRLGAISRVFVMPIRQKYDGKKVRNTYNLFHAFVLLNGKLYRQGNITFQELRLQL